MNFRQLLQHFVDQLFGLYDADEAAAVFFTVAAHISGLDRPGLLVRRDDLLPEDLTDRYLLVLDGLVSGKPVQYVLGTAYFYGLFFMVSPAVLIPRPETEELVDWVIGSCRQRMAAECDASLQLLDIGTGSGCIAVSLKKNLNGVLVYALDVSEEALGVARTNAAKNEVSVGFVHADVRNYCTDAAFDVIVSNPPYVTGAERSDMLDHVLDHEPHLALFVPDHDPLEFYRAIADFALVHLNPGGLLFFEINAAFGAETVELLRDRLFTDIELRKDMQGRDRMIRCRFPGAD